ncbi:MAG: NHLP bacteriocin system secretion protein [Isosphaeraceae bacterium]
MSRRSATGLAILAEDRPAEAFEQLDSVLRIVSLRHWFFLSLILLVLASFGVFACFYSAPLKVEGRGILLSKVLGDEAPLLQATAPAAGRLTRVRVRIGGIVERGEVLAEIDQSEQWDEFDEADAQLAALVEEDQILTEFDENEARLRAEALGKLETTLQHNLLLDSRRLDDHKRALDRNRTLRQRQYLSDLEALRSQSEADAVESAVGSTQAKLDELKYDRFEDQSRRKKDRTKRRLAIEQASTKLSLLSQRLERDTRIVSPYPGQIVDLMISEHALVEKGGPVALIRAHSETPPPIEAIVFVPAGLGKKIEVGHEVEIAPDTIRRQEHGYIHGRVSSISEIPATEMAMLAELKHKNLVTSFVQEYDGQVLLCLHVGLIDYPTNGPRDANGFVWSSVSGARQRVSTGTLCAASIVVETRPLITLVFPWLKELVGLY